MKNKLKMKLLDEYIKLYQVLYICKQRIFLANISEKGLNELCEKANVLKKEFDKTFQILKMEDASLILFKEQLDRGVNKQNEYYKFSNVPSTQKLLSNLNDIKKNKDKIFNKLLPKKNLL